MAYKAKRKPRIKQAEALKQIKGKRAFALLMEMRVGKTKVITDHYGRLEYAGAVEDLLVIAPAGPAPTWITAINDEYSPDLLERSRIHIWESGTYGSAKRKKELKEFLAYRGPRTLIMNVEALSTVKAARDTAEAFCKRRTVVAIDESTCIMNPGAERTKYILKNIKPLADYRYILTGLVTPRSPLNLFTQFYFLDEDILGHNSYTTFQREFAILKLMDMGGRKFNMVVGYRDEDKLARLIKPHSFRVRLADCTDLDTTYTIRPVTMTPDQVRIYKEIKDYATSELAQNSHVTATAVITQMLRMHQVLCGHVTDELGNEMTIPENKTKELMAFLREVEGKTIIWCSYDHDIRKITNAIELAYNPIALDPRERKKWNGAERWPEPVTARFWGGNKKTRDEEARAFKTDPKVRWIIATPDAGRYGQTWDMADTVAYYSSKNNLDHRAQSEARAQNVGKTKPILYADFIVPGTVEEKILHALRNKIDLAATISGDNWREWVV